MGKLKFSKKVFLKEAIGNSAWYSKGGFEPGAEHFLKAYYDDAVQNDALRVTCHELLLLASEFWMLGNTRKVGKSVVKVHRIDAIESLRDRFDVVEIITDDRRFLVDSAIGEISIHGVDVLALFHPVVTGFRDADGSWINGGETVTESMIQVLIPTQTAKIREAIRKGIVQTLKDLNRVIKDFKPMLALLQSDLNTLRAQHGSVSGETLAEACAFLEWIRDGNFVMLGTRTYEYQKGLRKSEGGKGRSFDYANPEMIENTCLGVLRDKPRSVLRQSNEPSNITSNFETFLGEKEPVTVAKANLFSRVHRHVRMDYISVKHYTLDGKIRGETRFVGLFTADAYERSPKYVPLIRHKIQKVIDRYGADPNSHNGKRLDFVLSTFPRDELFQCSEKELYRIATGIAQAFDRPRTRLFVREDPFKRFISALVYVPREHYGSRVRHRIGSYLAEAYGGRVSAFYPQYSDSPLARVHFIIGLDPDSYLNPKFSTLEKSVARLSQPWGVRLRSAAEERGDTKLLDLVPTYQDAFTPAYQSRFADQEAISDIDVACNLTKDHSTDVRVYSEEGDDPKTFRVKFYSWKVQSELSDVMPIFANMALHVIQETSYRIKVSEDHVIWINDYKMRLAFEPESHDLLATVFRDALLAINDGLNEDDEFNRLILQQSVNWRMVAMLRLVARYRLQSGLDPAELVQVEALAKYPEITKGMIELFEVKFDPSKTKSMVARQKTVEAIQVRLLKSLDQVISLDDDKALRRMIDTLAAALRTNFYIGSNEGRIQPFISLKIDSGKAGPLPAPVPYREIFVWSPRVEGVHLRFGPVARGGLRWSDRRGDFRTEVLGLVKAQQVKNTVIVPVGSKGGFYAKKLSQTEGRDAFFAEGIASYKQFISGLLDITDTYVGNGTIAPKDTICWDDPDPYLVVAADKGTATFSDIANGISKDYGFWLGDAFASGGSVGYDHKVMGITARGGWEAVKRHFREIGKDIQSEEFDVIGIGDMSGDVFGNGMLLSKQTRLIAAFDHRDIFIDPNPNPAKTFKERQRMFETPGTTWQNFNKKLISKGGGVFSRSTKSVRLSAEMKEISGLDVDEIAPNELIKALLKAPCELLWFGGIGTYIKSAAQSHADVSDKANDPIRVNGYEVRARVIGEGANLGATQPGRVEFAQNGGHVNTDAIDNSAGVDCSDNEVNIKILIDSAIANGELKANRRTALLAKMTDDVSELVLQHNYDQTLALSLAEMQAIEDHSAYGRFMDDLEVKGQLDRDVEYLPSTAEMQKRADSSKGMARPEIAVLNAYAKLNLYNELVESDIAKDKYYDQTLQDYFPKALHGFEKSLKNHRLRNEIIASRLCNQIVDTGGPLFMERLKEQTSAHVQDIAAAFSIARDVLKIDEMRASIAKLDNQVDAKAQLSLHYEIELVLQRVIGWLLRHTEKGTISQRILQRSNDMKQVDETWISVLSTYDSRRAKARIGGFVRAGIPLELAQDVALLRARATGFDVMTLKDRTGWPIRKVAELFYDIGSRFKIDRLRAMSMKTMPQTHWEKLAQKRIEEDFYSAQADLAHSAAVLHIRRKGKSTASTQKIIDQFVDKTKDSVTTYDDAFAKVSATGNWTLAKFAIINTQLRELIGK
jgi:glutamate dehydrogenase